MILSFQKISIQVGKRSLQQEVYYVMLREVRMLFNISKISRMNIKYKPYTLITNTRGGTYYS